jgi:predicted amidohydrolase
VRTFYYQKGIQLYCAPTMDNSEEWQHSMRHIGVEGRCFVLSPSQFARQKECPTLESKDAASADPEKIIFAGGSVIVSPQGVVLAGPLREEEGVLTADLELDDSERSILLLVFGQTADGTSSRAGQVRP